MDKPGLERLVVLVERIQALTEEKIAAALGRDPIRLEGLLHEEIPELVELRSLLPQANRLSPTDSQVVKQKVALWLARSEYLQEILQTQLGYIDFVRYVLGVSEPVARVDQTL